MTGSRPVPPARGPGAIPSIRRAAREDLPAVEALLRENALPTAGVADALATFLVADDHGTVAGVVGLEICGEHGLLRSAAVAPAWRTRGVGGRLIEQAIAEARLRGLRSLVLLTTTAEGYFPRFGFAVTTRDAVPPALHDTIEFRGACPASAVVMRLALDATR